MGDRSHTRKFGIVRSGEVKLKRLRNIRQLPSCRIDTSTCADAVLSAAVQAAGFRLSVAKAVDLVVADCRGAAPDVVPDTAGFGSAPTLLVCDALQAERWSAGVDGATHCIVAPFTQDALRLQLALLFANTRQSADDLPSLQEQLAHLAQTGPRGLHAMLIGLRRMAAINATYGPLVGDAALEAVGDRIARHVARHSGADAFTARLSGGDFLIAHVMPEERLGWQVVAEQLLRVISRPLDVAGHRLRLTARASLALAKPDEDPVSLLDRLSTGLAMARESPAEPVRWADRQSDHAPLSGYRLEQDIVHAIERDEITVLFQPQFSVRTGQVTGAEALARWQHPQHGEIGAGTLFALADKADFTRQLSRHIRERALRQAATWTGPLAGLRLSVNVTAEDLAESGYARREIRMIAASGFDAERLTLEITESELVPDLKRAAARFAALRAAGVRIAVDDFGTGYSNLLYLKSLPLDYLKLDHAMTRDIGGEEADRIIVRSIIAMARALDLQVIAEGVESDAQLDALREEDCDYFQGFLRGGAMEAGDFMAFATQALSR